MIATMQYYTVVGPPIYLLLAYAPLPDLRVMLQVPPRTHTLLDRYAP